METQTKRSSSRINRGDNDGTDEMDKPVIKNRKLSYKLCLHCNKELNIKIYKEHKRLYYDSSKGIWSQDAVLLNSDDEGLSDFSSPGESDHDTDPAVENEMLEDFNVLNTESYHTVDFIAHQKENANQY